MLFSFCFICAPSAQTVLLVFTSFKGHKKKSEALLLLLPLCDGLDSVGLWKKENKPHLYVFRVCIRIHAK